MPGCPSPLTTAYHKFPDREGANPDLYDAWVRKVFGKLDAGGATSQDFSQATVCGHHFKPQCFEIVVEVDDSSNSDVTATPQAKQKTVLRDDAVPTQNLNPFAK